MVHRAVVIQCAACDRRRRVRTWRDDHAHFFVCSQGHAWSHPLAFTEHVADCLKDIYAGHLEELVAHSQSVGLVQYFKGSR